MSILEFMSEKRLALLALVYSVQAASCGCLVGVASWIPYAHLVTIPPYIVLFLPIVS